MNRPCRSYVEQGRGAVLGGREVVIEQTRRRFVTLRSLAIAMAAVEVAIHAVLAPSHLQETPYIGALFVALTVILTGVLISLLLPGLRRFGWLIGAAVCAGMFVAFIASRTVGLPSYHETWTSDGGLGLLSLPPEIVFIGCAAHAVRMRRAPADHPYPIRFEDTEQRVETREQNESLVAHARQQDGSPS